MLSLTTESLTEEVAASLSWLSKHGFKYFKSFQHFRKTNDNGHSYIQLNAITHNRNAYYLAFYIGVQITEVEKAILDIRGESRKISHYDRTIWNYTVNIGPKSPHWSFPISGTWTGCSRDDFVSATPEISRFISELALPFVTENSDPAKLRNLLVYNPGYATHIYPYRSILAIDHLFGTEQQLQEDIALLDRRYAGYGAQPRQEFDEFVAKTLEYKREQKRSGCGL
jgi:hypothetical protein